MKFVLGPEHRRLVDDMLARYLDMDTANRTALIDDVQRTGTLRVFGYGSLIRDPHAPPDTQSKAYIEGYARDLVHSDRHYRGTPRQLGITLGIVPAKNPREKLWGLLQTIHVDSAGNNAFITQQIVRYIQNLALREVSLNPIYRYKVVDVKGRFGAAKAILCGTDETNPHYIGPTVQKAGGRDMTFAEKAALWAGAMGVRNVSKRNTGIDYACQIFDGYRKARITPGATLVRLASMANAYRKLLPPRQRFLLLARELAAHDPIDRKILGIDRRAAQETPRAVERHRRRAQRKLGPKDPLTPKKRAWIERNKRELSNVRAARLG